MKLDLSKKIIEFLQQNAGQKFTAREIAQWIFETFPAECNEKLQTSRNKFITGSHSSDEKNDALINAIAAEIGARRPHFQKKEPRLKITESRPRHYYFTEETDTAEVIRAEASLPSSPTLVDQQALREHDLYVPVSEFLMSEFGMYSKRIDEKRSRNSHGAGGNKWLYPDIVGMEDLSAEWHREIKDCVQQYADKMTKLWSFEVKILVNRSNVREVFFQTVSNSSWANFAYLIASEIDSDALKELRILAGLHGIGFIRLDVENPAESEIMIPARERAEIDWHTANRLAEENKDFLEYIKLVRQFYQTGDTRPSEWDVAA